MAHAQAIAANYPRVKTLSIINWGQGRVWPPPAPPQIAGLDVRTINFLEHDYLEGITFVPNRAILSSLSPLQLAYDSMSYVPDHGYICPMGKDLRRKRDPKMLRMRTLWGRPWENSNEAQNIRTKETKVISSWYEPRRFHGGGQDLDWTSWASLNFNREVGC